MVALAESALAVLAYLSAITATLRAGTRAVYLMKHNHIGVMDGPLILGPDDIDLISSNSNNIECSDGKMTVSPLWDVTYAFKKSVELVFEPSAFNDLSQTNKDSIVKYEILSPPNTIHNIPKESYSISGYRPVPKSTPPKIFSTSVSKTKVKEDIITNLNMFYDELKRNKGYDYDTTVSSIIMYVNNTNTTDSLGTHCGVARITAYAPQCFADLRKQFDIDENAFQQSILKSGPFVSFQSNSKGAARAGGIFFFTRDGSYMIKSIKKEEIHKFLSMLPKYHKFMQENGRRSLLTRFCGMFAVKLGVVGDMNSVQEHVFVVMNSVFPAEASQYISERYDLKGSTVGRECSEDEKLKKGRDAVLKDLDLAREVELVREVQQSLSTPSPKLMDYGLHIGAKAKSALLSQLRRDTALLVDCDVMDYSLLVGVVNVDAHRVDGESLQVLQSCNIQEALIEEELNEKRKNKQCHGLSPIAKLFRAVLPRPRIPSIYFGRNSLPIFPPFFRGPFPPYYGSNLCGVNGGKHSILNGKRAGRKAIYYMGLIDFLQPWTTRKVMERQMKGILGNNVHEVSCVHPEEYATRFLDFIDAHVS